MQLIDTHNHVIPFVDDGAEDWNTSLQMLKGAEEDGITELVCTPHVLSNKDLQQEQKFLDKFYELKQRASDAHISIKLHVGSEMYVQPDYQFHHKLATLAQNGRYFLIEFPMSMIPPFASERFFDLFSEQYVPIIAHPERNGGILRDISHAYNFVEKGTLLQVTAGSLLGVFGSEVRTMAHQLMDANLVHIIATDAHDLTRRKLKLRRAYDYVSEKWGPERADMLFRSNPQKVINGETIEVGSPLPLALADTGPESFTDKLRSFFRR